MRSAGSWRDDPLRLPPCRCGSRTRSAAAAGGGPRGRNLGRAAAAWACVQPAATKLLQQVEEATGVTLFTRLARGMEPTPSGEVLIRYARQALTDFGFAREQMAALRSGLRGRLRLGIIRARLPEDCWRRRSPNTSGTIRAGESVLVDEHFADVMLAHLPAGRGGRRAGAARRRPGRGRNSKPAAARRAAGGRGAQWPSAAGTAHAHAGGPGALALGPAAARLAAAQPLRGGAARGGPPRAAGHHRNRVHRRDHGLAGSERHGGGDAGQSAGGALRDGWACCRWWPSTCR